MATLTHHALRAVAARTRGLCRLRRPETANAPSFDLAYVRAARSYGIPIVVIPGGPGLASVLPYRGLRAQAARRGLDVIMIEHRGVGLSRTGRDGRDLPASAMWVTDVVDDIAAVLDREGIDRSYIVGASYGSYLASAFGARHPDRVAGMLLDSALQSTHDLDIERACLRDLFWNAETPEAHAVRELIAAGEDERRVLGVVRAAYELGGAALTRPLLAHRVKHPRSTAWSALELYAGRGESLPHLPFSYEFGLAGVIAFRELHYGAPPDGQPLDPALTYQPLAPRFPAFGGERFDLPAAAAGFTWTVALLSGTRDLRTPPAIAERTASIVPDATLALIDNGHSALESHPLALLHATRRLVEGKMHLLPAETAAIDRMPRRGLTARIPALLAAGLRVDVALHR